MQPQTLALSFIPFPLISLILAPPLARPAPQSPSRASLHPELPSPPLDPVPAHRLNSSIRIVVKKAEKRPAITQHRTLLRTAVTPDPTSVSKSNSRSNGSSQKSSASTKTVSRQGPAVVKRVSPETSATSLTKGKPQVTLPKPSGSGACKRKEAPTMAFDEARLARAKIRLHEGYKEASTVKENRKIQIIAAAGKGRPHPSQVRCTAAGGTGKRPPVPSCPRMSRAA
ncbi:unnamed protein product [Urochloa humidicola]